MILGLFYSNTFARDTVSLNMPNSSATQCSEFNENIWISLDRQGGIVEYDVKNQVFYKRNDGFKMLTITDMVVHEGHLYASHKFEGVFKYDLSTLRWTNVMPKHEKDSSFFTLASVGKNLVAGGQSGRLYASSNGGVSWTGIHLSDNFNPINTICPIANGVLVGTNNTQMFHLDKMLKNPKWVDIKTRGRTHFGFFKIQTYQNSIYAVNLHESIMRSDDQGRSWYKWSANSRLNNVRNFLAGDELLFYVGAQGLFTSNDGSTLDQKEWSTEYGEYLTYFKRYDSLQLICTNQRIMVVH